MLNTSEACHFIHTVTLHGSFHNSSIIQMRKLCLRQLQYLSKVTWQRAWQNQYLNLSVSRDWALRAYFMLFYHKARKCTWKHIIDGKYCSRLFLFSSNGYSVDGDEEKTRECHYLPPRTSTHFTRPPLEPYSSSPFAAIISVDAFRCK